MTNSKVVLFGSFTESETKSWVKPSSGVTEPVKRKKTRGLHASDFTTVSNNVGDKQPGVINSPRDALASKSAKIINAERLNEVKDLQFGSSGSLSGIDIIQKSALYSTCNGRKDSRILEGIGIDSLLITDTDQVSTETPFCFKNHDMNGEILQVSNGRVSDPSEAVTQKSGFLLASDGFNTAIRDILPRGLINSGNLCFLNSTLQALLSCSPFVQLIQRLRNRNISKVSYPTLAAFAEFIAEFDFPSGVKSNKNEKNTIETGRPFSPSTFEGVLKKFTPDILNSIYCRPRQEDAQEFLSFIMHQMHDELLKFEGQMSNVNGTKFSLVSYAEDDEWETVGPKNKSAVTRTQKFVPSELSEIFGGQLRSVVKATGNKASATIQPFLLLHLDISHESVLTIEHALRLFSVPEMLDGYRTSTTGKDYVVQAGVVDARKSLSIQKLPKILILHLMRFRFGSHGSTKLHKPVGFPIELVLGRDLLVSASTEGGRRRYELVATITHHGREASKGHYTTDSSYPNGVWLRFDDASVDSVGLNKVLHDQAYVLFYRQL